MSGARGILAAALLTVSLSFAQDNSANRNSDQTVGGNTGSTTVQGCLSSSAMGDNNFTLTEDGTGTVYRLLGNSGDLTSHTGQQVAITGKKASTSAPNSDTTDNSPSSRDGSGMTLQVDSIQKVADHCSSAGSGSHSGKGGEDGPATASRTSADNSAVATEESTSAERSRAAPNRPRTHATARPETPPQTDLPQAATILPLLGFVGLSSLLTGFIFRER